MKKYKLTHRGKAVAVILALLAVGAMVNGSVYIAIYIFAFCLIALGLSVYEFYINR